jgi:uncharacterized protein YaaR (DUF327 family)
MERVSGDGFFSYRRDVRRREESRKTGRVSGSSRFSEIVESDTGLPALESALSDDEAAELLDRLFAAGDHLKRRQDSQSFREYRQAVRDFIGAVVQSGIEVEERTSGSTIQKRKRYALLSIIDTKLEQLAAGMISSQRAQLDLLAKVDEINGLLVDLRQ